MTFALFFLFKYGVSFLKAQLQAITAASYDQAAPCVFDLDLRYSAVRANNLLVHGFCCLHYSVCYCWHFSIAANTASAYACGCHILHLHTLELLSKACFLRRPRLYLEVYLYRALALEILHHIHHKDNLQASETGLQLLLLVSRTVSFHKDEAIESRLVYLLGTIWRAPQPLFE